MSPHPGFLAVTVSWASLIMHNAHCSARLGQARCVLGGLMNTQLWEAWNGSQLLAWTGDIQSDKGHLKKWCLACVQDLGCEKKNKQKNQTADTKRSTLFFFLSFSSLYLNLKSSERGEESWKGVRKHRGEAKGVQFTGCWVVKRGWHLHKVQRGS